jgi:hypothetical protein
MPLLKIQIQGERMPRPKGNTNQSELIKLAIAGIDAQIRELTEKRIELSGMASGATVAVAMPRVRKGKLAAVAVAEPAKKRKVSAATRKKLKEAAKARWAKARSEKSGK